SIMSSPPDSITGVVGINWASNVLVENVYLQQLANGAQIVALSGNPTGGTFTLTFGGETTSPIPYNADMATVQAALEALSSIGANNVSVTGVLGGWKVTFTNALGYGVLGAITGDGDNLTPDPSPGAPTPKVVITPVQPNALNLVQAIQDALSYAQDNNIPNVVFQTGIQGVFWLTND